MPETRKESLVFGSIMCCGMVLVMASYNLILNGQLGELTISEILLEVLIGFCIALVLDLFCVGPAARAVTAKLPFDHSNKLLFVLSMSGLMVLGMVFFMSIFGLVTSMLAHGLDGQVIVDIYSTIFLYNFIVALPLQLLIMGPLVRFIFIKWSKPVKQTQFATE